MNSLVSVIIPTCNRYDFLIRAVKSIERQTYKNLEIIVIDDYSDIVINKYDLKKYTSKPIKLIRNEIRKGGAVSRNIGIDLSEGDYFCFLDDDDEYYSNKVEDLLNFLIFNKYDAVFGKVDLKNGNIKVNKFSIPDSINSKKNIILMNVIHNNATLIHRKCKVRFYEKLTRYQDMQYNLELWYKYKVGFFKQPIAVWYVEDRKDKITSASSLEKKEKDLRAFIYLYRYLSNNLGFSRFLLASYTLKLVKESFVMMPPKDFIKLFFSLKFSLFGAIVSYIYRKRFFK
ncbi:glycosyltransferase family 2 protein [Acinetobacter wanghuae]|uniref:glycosyltransferase family 2 protein n=1 Tax=Acinetobacter wanghuae TaxID=2662362 RepID=UPI003AF808EB